jgi:hypothetical protein
MFDTKIGDQLYCKNTFNLNNFGTDPKFLNDKAYIIIDRRGIDDKLEVLVSGEYKKIQWFRVSGSSKKYHLLGDFFLSKQECRELKLIEIFGN